MSEMNRRNFLSAAAAASIPAPAQQPTKPNILLILGDNQQAATIANRSLCRTPNVNRLAAEGMLFQRAYTNAAVCSPARNALLTGAFNWRFGTYNQPDTISAIANDPFPDIVTYAQLLSRAGYRCGYNGKWHTSTKRTPFDFGYHDVGAPNRYRDEAARRLRARGITPHDMETKRKTVRTVQWPGSEPFGLWGYTEGDEEQTELHHVAEGGIRMLREFSRRAQPWLIEVHFPEAFRAWPLRKYRDRYDSRSIPVPRSFRDTFAGKPAMQRREAESYGPMSEQDFREGRAFYYASFEELDAQVGRLLRALDETGQADNTVVVFAADHGAPWGAHRMWLPCFAPYEEIYRIPMAVRWPGHVKAGTVCDGLVQLHDLGHTFTEIAGAAALPHAHGASIAPLLRDPKNAQWRDMILCAWYGQNFLMNQRMAITSQHKYVFNTFDYDECYDLRNDPEEMRNIAAERRAAPVVDDMRARLYELMERFGDPHSGQGPSGRFLAPRYLPRGKRLPAI
jgi:arylsulfatase A-like enzyme